MASPAGNPNPNPGNPNPPFEMAMLFRPPPNPAPTAAPMFPGAAGPPPPSGPYSYPPATPPFHLRPYLHYPQDPQPPMPRPVIPFPMPNPNANPNPSANPMAAAGANPGARLMQLLGSSGSGHLESAVSMPPPSSEFAAAQPSPLPAMPSAPPARMLSSTSSKVPRGRLLGGGDKAVHNVDSRLPGEAQPPQLEVTPITKYTSDPGLVLGRQIAVNRTYIVYGLKLGNIRVLNINTALRSLLRGHTQRVTDMAFFAEDVHRLASASVDGRIYVWRIDEGPDAENKPQITGKIEVAIQIVGDAEAYHPRICWHSHKQELLFVGIRNCVLRIDTTKVGRGRDFTAEEPIKCHLDDLIDGVRLVGRHDGDVTDLSISQWMTTRLASGSNDGTVKIWDDRKLAPLSILKPHDGQAVYSVAFLTAPERPHHINLITAGPLNREIKIWASTNEEGWLLPSDSESWNCTQTLELVSSLEPKVEEAFFNQVAVLPQASIILLANAKKNAIYAVHVEYGSDPASTRLDYIADFTVAMPILSLTGTHESQPDGEQVVQVYCVQTMAIQQYGLELSLCSPPTSDTIALGRDPAISRVYDTPLEVVGAESSTGTSFTDSSKQSTFDQTSEFDLKPSAPPLAYTEGDGSAHLPSAPLASNTDLTGSGPSVGNRDKDQSVFDYSTSRITEPVALTRQDTPMPKPLALARQDTPMPKDNFGKGELRDSHSDVQMLPNPRMMFKDDSISSPRIAEVEAKHVDEIKSDLELEAVKEAQVVHENSEKAQNSLEQTVEMISERSVTTDKYSVEESRSPSGRLVPDHTGAAGENVQNKTVEKPGTSDYSSSSVSKEQSSSYTKENVFHPQASGQSSPSTSAFNSTESSHEPVSSAYPPIESSSEVADMLQQLIAMQKDMHKQLGTIVSAPIAKEGKRIETSLGRTMEKSIKASIDALWARFLEENTKREKAERERMQQMTTLITNSISKDLPAMLDKLVKREVSSLGPIVARAMTPIIEKSLTSIVADSVQKAVGDKVVNQLDKSVTAKLEATLARQIQMQFHTSVKQTLQDVLRTSFESLLVPAFEQSCKTMFEQVDSAFQKGMSEHAVAIQQQVEAAHTPLVLTLKETIASASSISQNLTSELLDGHRKLLALVTSGNANAQNTNVSQPNNGPITGPPEVEAPLDPMKELGRLLSEHKFDEAFTVALQRSDVSIVSWLCSQVDLRGLCTMAPVPLNQGVLLALLQQLAVDIGTETSRKIQWMTDVAMAINPTDQVIAIHVRPIFEQVYAKLAHHRSLPTTSPLDNSNLRLLMHVINSVLLSYK
ncbi:enhancer of mRNA-decapping protein 4-like isoform X2 [Hordeum vulgare subsp. vulgare]|uniref:enhancer of mRNA-decapping protein 4-like isoform X2 n=1 Tax=Hordeum vulgare subsp. vulgare TaxID=112509 RepID=UPI001D1A3AF7|nr:enhancer of mRNA-decapping protein 4-like isoform X2 [Hordeum vulgare subsp. vulgare]